MISLPKSIELRIRAEMKKNAELTDEQADRVMPEVLRILEAQEESILNVIKKIAEDWKATSRKALNMALEMKDASPKARIIAEQSYVISVQGVDSIIGFIDSIPEMKQQCCDEDEQDTKNVS